MTNAAGAAGAPTGIQADWLRRTRTVQGDHQPAGVYDQTSIYATEEHSVWESARWQGTPWTAPDNTRMVRIHYAAELGSTDADIGGGVNRNYRVRTRSRWKFFSALQRQGVPSKLLSSRMKDTGTKAAETASLYKHSWMAGDLREVARAGGEMPQGQGAPPRPGRVNARRPSTQADPRAQSE